MAIIAAWEKSSTVRTKIDIDSISPEERALIQEKHDQALKYEPTWVMFGGVITIGKRHFQVIE